MGAALILLLLASCSEDGGNGVLQVELIQASPQHCQYNITSGPVQTLTSILSMKGSIGQVLYNTQNLGSSPQILDDGIGFQVLDLQFAHLGNYYTPLDLTSLFASSLYYSMETGYLLFRGLDPTHADLGALVPNFAGTTMVYNARRTFGTVGSQPEVQDNAEYYADRVQQPDGSYVVRNYFFSYPTNKVAQVPLGLNLGIMVHEYTHFLFHYLFYEPAYAANVDTTSSTAGIRTLEALDEGDADYMGFMAAQDPGYFLCSYPSQPRDLSVFKPFTSSIVSGIQSGSNFDDHEGGASWASIQYQIGGVVGYTQNAQALILLMANLLNGCGSGGNGGTFNVDFPTLSNCHMQYLQQVVTDSSVISQVQQIYSQGLAGFGGGQ